MKSNKLLVILTTFIILILTISTVSAGITNVDPKDTNLELKISSSNDYIIATLKEGDNFLENQNITFSIIKEGKEINKIVKTDENGVAKLDISSLSSGKYNVNASFKGNEDYKNSSDSINFEISKIKTILKISKTDDLLSFKLTDNSSKGLSNKEISVIILDDHNEIIKNKIINTNSKGIATMNISKLANGNYNVMASFEADKDYESSSSNIYVNIDKKDSKKIGTHILILPNLISDDYISAMLFDENENPLPNKVLTFTITDKNGEIIVNKYATTNEDGLAFIDISGINLTDSDIYVSFLGDDNYSSSMDIFSYDISEYSNDTTQTNESDILSAGILAYLISGLNELSNYLNSILSLISSLLNNLVSMISSFLNSIINMILPLLISIISIIQDLLYMLQELLNIDLSGLISSIPIIIIILLLIILIIAIVLLLIVLYLLHRFDNKKKLI
ncbi:MAG: hypothetical protein MJ224_04940 [archaeon]|nr:hypothetical protein [archaeon]